MPFMRLPRFRFLGHEVSEGQIRVDESKLGRLTEWQPPLANQREVRQFLGFLSYYRAFIPHFADVTAPLTTLLRKKVGWQWTEAATQATEQAKRALIDARARYTWDPAREDRVTTDASDVGLGAVFEQKVDGVGWAPVAFWSRKLSDAETRYSTTDKEWLAVIEAVTRHWRHWLGGRNFVLRSDHAALRQLLREKGEQFTARQLRWCDRLSEFSFVFQHIPGPSNAAADALSRSPVECVTAIELQEGPPASLCAEDLLTAAQEDAEYAAEVQRVRQSVVPGVWVVDQEGMLRDTLRRVKVPNSQSLRIKLVLEAHEPAYCGHLGVKRTLARLQELWSWDSMGVDVERIVGACDMCQKDAVKRQKDQAPLQTIVVTRPWEVVTMDFLSGLTLSVPGKWTGCVVVCDRFTRMMHVKECSSHPTAEEAARLFMLLVVSRHGVPTRIITDRGTQFDSMLWYEFIQLLGSKVAMATTHHPQSNGLTERANRTLLSMIRRVCECEGGQWVRQPPLLELAYNSSVHSSTKVTPFSANFGYQPRLPASFLCAPDSEPERTVTSFCQKVQKATQQIWEQVRQASQEASQAAARRENLKRGSPEYRPGDEVLVWRHRVVGPETNTRKQELRYAGPFLVKEFFPPGVVELEGLPPQTPTKINVEYVHPYKRYTEAEELRARRVPPVASKDQGLRWEVERILDVRGSRKNKEYKVKWTGYQQPTWEPRRLLDRCPQLLREFHMARRR